jgi:hypothetical protein
MNFLKLDRVVGPGDYYLAKRRKGRQSHECCYRLVPAHNFICRADRHIDRTSSLTRLTERKQSARIQLKWLASLFDRAGGGRESTPCVVVNLEGCPKDPL